jgi:protein SCO1/2
MRREQVGDTMSAATTILMADQAALRQLTDALGYRYVYDSDTDQFAHPAAVYVMTADGRVARTLSALGFDADDLRLALVEAGEGRIGGVVDQLRLLCYGYDPAVGVYTLAIRRWLAFASAATVILLAGGIAFMLISRRPRAAACPRGSVPSEPA